MLCSSLSAPFCMDDCSSQSSQLVREYGDGLSMKTASKVGNIVERCTWITW
jgi:hypothetical protein